MFGQLESSYNGLNQKSQTIAEAEADTNDTLDRMGEDSIEEQSLIEHSPNPLIDTDSQAVGEAAQQVESGKPPRISEGEAM